MELIFLVVGIIVGSAAVFFIMKIRYSSLKNLTPEKLDELKIQINRADEKISLYETQLKELKDNLSKEHEKYVSLNAEYSKVNNENQTLEDRLKEQRQELVDLHERLKTEFKNLANEILEDKSKKFSEQSRDVVSNLLNPLGEKINDFRKRIDEIHRADTESRSTLVEQLRTLHELNKQMSEDAENLTRALKGDSKVMGTWGEFILESLLEKSGLINGEQYSIQESMTAEDGKKLRPDVIVYLPEGKNVIIDSKVSLTAYERFFSETEEFQKTKHFQDHILSIRNHIKELSGKNYQNLYGLNTPDFVLMFIPVEPAFGLAVQGEPTLFNDAFERNIVIVSPSTLLATLRTIENIWRREKQNKNALEIARQSGAMYDKFVGFVEDLLKVGKNLNDSKEAYSAAMNKLSSGRGNIIKRIEDIRELGAKATKSMPDKLLDRASGEE